MPSTLSRSPHADQRVDELSDAGCCDSQARCLGCQAKVHEVRAARRDAVIHSMRTTRPRRHAF